MNKELPSETLEALRNRKTHKLFIIVDDTLEMRYKVINPSGEVIILPDLLFEEDPITVRQTDFAQTFSAEQLAAYAQHLAKVAEQERLEALRPKQAAAPNRYVAEPAPPSARPRRNPAPKKDRGPVRRGIGAAWSSPRLTFYRHKIEPLHDKQSFRITLESGACYEIVKEEFMAHFNDVVMSPSYRAEGLFTYQEIPAKMGKYLRPGTP